MVSLSDAISRLYQTFAVEVHKGVLLSAGQDPLIDEE